MSFILLVMSVKIDVTTEIVLWVLLFQFFNLFTLMTLDLRNKIMLDKK